MEESAVNDKSFVLRCADGSSLYFYPQIRRTVLLPRNTQLNL